MKCNKIKKILLLIAIDPKIKTKLGKRLEHNFIYYKAQKKKKKNGAIIQKMSKSISIEKRVAEQGTKI